MRNPFAVAALLAMLTACGGGGVDGLGDARQPPATYPPPPTIGVNQIDRMGRSAITSALVSPLAPAAQRGADRDAYNMAARSSWADFTDEITASLPVYDALDAVCGNQFLAGPADASRYSALAGALVDDRLYVNGASGMCMQYFAVELNATGTVANDDCGGRTPLHDTVDVSYTALSNDLSTAVGDGVAADVAMHSNDAFPFLAGFTPSPSPPAVTLNQIDRMGRSAITSALISPIADVAMRGADRDAYNAAAESDWGLFSDNLRAHLAVYDALDANCGNQVLANPAVADPSRYDALTGALTDDKLYVNGSSGTCTQYLGVELDATGLVANQDCGGRTPLYDTVDVSYTALSNDLSIPVGDGVPQDNIVHSDSVFPFLANP